MLSLRRVPLLFGSHRRPSRTADRRAAAQILNTPGYPRVSVVTGDYQDS